MTPLQALAILRSAGLEGELSAAVDRMSALLQDVEALQRYDVTYNDPGCDCCGPSTEREACSYGDYVLHDDIAAALTDQ